ncbi:MAG: hypothetical protein QOE02_142 [Rhodospirillaceae bacterium]|jgi:uncharacterized membrane protein|nr:hypothetical protein [Rhodospirillaceae bacterium]MEA2850123.1 hypothetical protein [Rhodospirillaceae bacterium]
MTRLEFLETLRRRLAGLPKAEIDDLVADYATHFADGMAAGRSEAEIAEALGDPMRLARELRAEAGFRRWETERTPASFFAVLFGFVALVAVDFVFLLPLLGGLVLFTLIAAIVLLALCIAGIVLLAKLFSWDGLFAVHSLVRKLSGLGLLGVGIGGGALLLMMIDYVVRLLGRFARLHYELLNRADAGGAHG